MHVQQALRSRALVEVIDILRDQQKLALPFLIEPGERIVRGVGLNARKPRASGVVERLDQRWIAAEGFGSRDIFDAVAFP
jgi:hypothetical protein